MHSAELVITSTNSTVFVLLAWLFVLARIAHALIHTGSNSVPLRFYAAAASAVILAVMWLIFAIRILSTGA